MAHAMEKLPAKIIESGRMNSIRQKAEEIVVSELIFS